MPERGSAIVPEFSVTTRFAMAFRVGGMFGATAFTVTLNERLTALFPGCPSYTVTVIVALPTAPGAG